MPVPLTIVDSFTDQPFAGNPAGVCLLAEAAPDRWMQAVAAEVNLAETAFLVPRPDGDHDLRWFTPTVEVPLCGHATLASAHVLGGSGRFHTRSGLLTCAPAGDGGIAMDLPANPVTAGPDEEAPAWAARLGLAADRVAAVAHGGDDWVLVQAVDAAAVRAAVADQAAILAATSHAVVVVADTSADPGEPADSVCRVFAPGSGIAEDPVTGAAHCVVGPWLAARTGRTRFVGHQASRRGGTVGMEVRGDRVVVSGHATTVSVGELLVDPS
ncbi:PhzF family phenazine biosynthesis protein [Aquihabitans sp. G128]|uniref:PhzF family phenazine biosynthesis protein n=1 Tax=Aquihabitans sp. G128 TaxID=2849779 RepID=UPI0020B2950B|nr:PhzF family phenazine biosynthesis protein [Aquihabitans sp. G128]